MKTIINTIIRWWYLIFKKKYCIKIITPDDIYKFGDIVCINKLNNGHFKYLDKKWYHKME